MGLNFNLNPRGLLFARSWRDLFSLDLRVLGIFRIVLASILIFDNVDRLRFVRAFFSDFGIWPRDVATAELRDSLHWSLHFILNHAWFQGLLLVAALVFACGLLVGYRTRWCMILLWVLEVSIQNRNGIILQGGDVYLRILMFWSMFLPLGDRYSLDSKHSTSSANSNQHLSLPGAFLLIQIAVLYASSAYLKDGIEWRYEASAVQYALMLNQFATPFGQWLSQQVELTQILTIVTWHFEAWVWLLMFMPVFFIPLRLLAFLGIAGMHAGFALTMNLGLFPYICILGSLLVLSPAIINGFFSSADSEETQLAREHARQSLFRTMMLGILSIVFLCSMYRLVLVTAKKRLPEIAAVETITGLLRLDQRWDMFAPFPLKEDGWFRIPGTLRDGTAYDVYHQVEAEPSLEAPSSLSDAYPNERWRKYLMNIWLTKYAWHRNHYARYLCRSTNERLSYDRWLVSFSIYYAVTRNDIRDSGEKTYEFVKLWDHRCN